MKQLWWCKGYCWRVLIITGQYFLLCHVERHGLQTPNEAFFHWNPKLLGLSRQIGQINFGVFSVFSAELLAPILDTVSPFLMFSIIKPLFLQKTKPLYSHIKYLFGIGICIWVTNNSGFSLCVSKDIALQFYWMITVIKDICTTMSTKKGQWGLQVYVIANFVASWLKWLQMTFNEFKWLSVCLINQVKTFGVIWDHLESFEIIWSHLDKSWGDKISFTINMQRLLSFCLWDLGDSDTPSKMSIVSFLQTCSFERS
jgi:hypothetical protein